MDYPMSRSKLIYRADLQSKLNDSALQQILLIRDEVIGLEQEEFTFFEPQVHGLKYVQEVLNNLRYKTERQHQAEKDLLDREMQITEINSSDALANPLSKKIASDWLNSEGTCAMQLGQHVIRLMKQLEVLKVNKQISKPDLMDVVSIQSKLMKNLKTKTKELEDLEKEFKKIQAVDAVSVKKTKKPQVKSKADQEELTDKNQTLKFEVMRLKEELIQDYSETAFLEADMMLKSVTSEFNKLEEQSEEVYTEAARNMKQQRNLQDIFYQKDKFVKEQHKAKVDTAERITSQTSFLAEKAHDKKLLLTQKANHDHLVEMCGRFEKNRAEQESLDKHLNFFKKKLLTQGEENITLFNMKEGFTSKIQLARDQALDFEKELESDVSEDTQQNGEDKLSPKKLSEELRKISDAEKKIKHENEEKCHQLAEFEKELKSVQERLDAREAERTKSAKQLHSFDVILEAEIEFAPSQLNAYKEKEISVQQQLDLLENQLIGLEKATNEATQENENLRKIVISTAEEMNKAKETETSQPQNNTWWQPFF